MLGRVKQYYVVIHFGRKGRRARCGTRSAAIAAACAASSVAAPHHTTQHNNNNTGALF